MPHSIPRPQFHTARDFALPLHLPYCLRLLFFAAAYTLALIATLHAADADDTPYYADAAYRLHIYASRLLPFTRAAKMPITLIRFSPYYAAAMLRRRLFYADVAMLPLSLLPDTLRAFTPLFDICRCRFCHAVFVVAAYHIRCYAATISCLCYASYFASVIAATPYFHACHAADFTPVDRTSSSPPHADYCRYARCCR